MIENSIVRECIKPVDRDNVIILNPSHDVSNALGDKTHLRIMLSLGVYAC